MTAIEKVIAIATQEVGYLEKASNKNLDSKTGNAGLNNYTKYARDLDKLQYFNGPKNGYPWCAVFYNWCLVQAFGMDAALVMTNQKKGSYGASCTSAIQYYKSSNQWYKTPQLGDQIFFNDSKGNPAHTGIVVSITDNKIYTIEGNTSSAAGVIANGGCVAKKSYNLTYSRITGYGRPNWNLVKEDEEEMLSYEQFRDYMNQYIEELANSPITWEKEAMDYMVSKGLYKSDEQNRLMAKKFVTRGELATVLQRALK